ncbi:MAG TPA: MFS transporter [Solirubrobacteraceae bacterium]|nr:MFS transporter [Solirubrobacteraceae bacterium]
MPARSSRTRAALYAGGFLGPFGGGMVVVLVPELRDAFGISTSAASLALTAYLVPFAALQLVSGTIGERVGRARATRAAYVLYGLASLAAAAAGGYGAFLAARAVQGVANAFTTPLVLAGLAESTPDASLGRAMGTFAAVQTAGVVSAPLIGGLAGALDYRLAFVAAAAAAALLAAVPVPGARPRVSATDAPARLRDAVTPRTRWTAAAAFLAYLGVTGIGVVVALRAGDAFGLGPTGRGLLLAGFGAAGVVVGRPAGGAADRYGAVRVTLAGAVPCVALVPLLGLAPGWPALALGWIAVGVCSALVWAGLNVLTVGAAPANRGGAVSLVGAFKFTGNALAPAMWLPLYVAHPRAAFAAAGAVSALLGAATARAGAVPPERRARARARQAAP